MQRKTEPSALQARGDWEATREEAINRLATFSGGAARRYGETRNFDLGPAERSNVSVLSPYIRHRLVTEDEVIASVLERHGPQDVEKFIQEVCWRTYWKGWLEMRPAVWDHYLADVARLQAFGGSSLDRAVAAATSGATGIECFDAWAQELVETGYLHNHARMWFASIWIYTLKLPWQLGAEFFLSHLLDGDPASNTLSWRWMCGLHTPGKTYLARADNIERYTKGRFNVPSDLADEAPALDEPAFDQTPRRIAAAQPAPAGPAVLVITEEDLHPETLPLRGVEVQHVVVLGGAPSYRMSSAVASFKERALADAAKRAERHFWCPPVVLRREDDDTAARIAALAAGKPVVMAELAVGPLRDALAPHITGLAEADAPVTFVRRPWDDRFWPHAQAGFFALRKQIPRALGDLGLLD